MIFARRSLASSAEALQPVVLRELPSQPLVSVLVPNHDYGAFLPDALKSLMRQTYDRFEVVICDDGSTDDSVSVAKRHCAGDSRFHLVRHPTNRGQAAAFNTAFARARGEIIAFLDADDTFEPGKLAEVVAHLRRRQSGLVIHPLTLVDANRRPIARIPSFTRFEDGWLSPRVLRRGGRWRWVPTSGVAMHRDIAERLLPMPEVGFRTSADTYLLILAALLTPIGVIHQILGAYRRHGGNAFARTVIDQDWALGAANNLRRSIECVNERLAELGLQGILVHPDDNLKYHEFAFIATLLDGHTSRSSLLHSYLTLKKMLRNDDLFDGLQKTWAATMYLAAIGLPAPARAPWLSVSLSLSLGKETLRRILASTGRQRSA